MGRPARLLRSQESPIPSQTDLLADVERRRIALPERGVEMAVIDWGGEGPLALLHHANGLCGALWGLLVQSLRPHFRCVALDARGHGDSTKPEPVEGREPYAWMGFVHDLVALTEVLVEERGGEPVAYGVGNSFGGLVTAYAAALRPELFARVAMLDPVIRPRPEQAGELHRKLRGRGEARAQEMGSGTNPIAETARRRKEVWPSREVARKVWSRKALFQHWDPRALDLYVAEGMRDRPDGQVELKCPAAVEAAVFDATGMLDIFEVADRLKAPALILRAGRGHFPMSVYEAVVERITEGRLLELDIDHLMPMHNPPVLAETLLDFAGVSP